MDPLDAVRACYRPYETGDRWLIFAGERVSRVEAYFGWSLSSATRGRAS